MGGEIRQLIPELVGQRTLVHIDRNDVGLSTAILHGGRIGHGVGEVHRYAAAGRQRLDAVGGDDGGQLRHIRAAGHGDGNGIGAVVHRTAFHHLITIIGRYGNDDLIALIGAGAVGDDGTALGGVHCNGVLTGIWFVSGDPDLQGCTLAAGCHDHDVDITGIPGQIADGEGRLTRAGCTMGGRFLDFIHRGSRCIVIHYLIVVGACHIGGERHRCGGLAAAGGGAIGQ